MLRTIAAYGVMAAGAVYCAAALVRFWSETVSGWWPL